MKKKITLKDIAKELDVSISTVSKALKNSKEISEETKETIQSFAKFYSYRPNNMARNLRNKQTKNIGVFIPEIVHHFYATIIKGIEEYINIKGYNLIICVTNNSYKKEVASMELLANGSIDGLIVSISAETKLNRDFDHLVKIMKLGMPLVLLGNMVDEIVCDKVIVDDSNGGGYFAVKKFIDNGNKKIALLTTENDFFRCKDIEKGYRQALNDHNILIDEKLILKLSHMDNNNKTLEEFFDNEHIDAVLAVNEIFGTRSIAIAQKKGLKIPEVISFISFTDDFLSNYVNPRLTIIKNHGSKMGEVAAEMLIEKIESKYDKEIYRTKIVESIFIERESTINKPY